MRSGQDAVSVNPWCAIRFTVVLPPRGKSTPQARALTDSNGVPVRSARTGRIIVHQHPTQDQRRDEQKLEALVAPHAPARPLKGPILLGIKAYLAIPQNLPEALRPLAPEKGKKAWFRQAALAGEVRPVRKPDWSNIVKHVEDVMSGMFWADDSLIIGSLPDSGKYYGDPERYEFTILYRREFQYGEADNAGGGP